MKTKKRKEKNEAGKYWQSLSPAKKSTLIKEAVRNLKAKWKKTDKKA
ncbi:MAG: hypothetical protein V1911_04350 [Candidatus Micrarchaeota archaeon]